MLSGATRVMAQEVAKEYQLKAAYLYNFTKFVQWPRERFANDTSPIIIGVLGRNPFGDELEKIVQGRTVNGRPILVKFLHTAVEVGAVHLLFVSAGEETEVPPATWENAGIVSVGETAKFAALGGTIVFTEVGDKLRFEINITAADRDGVKISAQLQKLATVVRHQP